MTGQYTFTRRQRGARNVKSPSILTRIMAEHVYLPGTPIVVTRGYVYQWFKRLGYSEAERGFGSMDYQTFSRHEVDEPLTDLSEPWAVGMLEMLERDTEAAQ